jgi:TDG/mug DNA glycosylase family protein
MSAVPSKRLQSFAPVARRDARVLILGSMPGAASLSAQQYYAHPRNHFWPIMQRLHGIDASLPYQRRLERLRQNHVALWDVLESCKRHGSLDAAIEHDSAVPNDLPQLLRTHPGIVRLCCNGGTAYRALQRHFGAQLQQEFPQLECLQLPSTSPAHAGMPFTDKLAAWHAALKGA